jgi:hypothetical protein
MHRETRCCGGQRATHMISDHIRNCHRLRSFAKERGRRLECARKMSTRRRRELRLTATALRIDSRLNISHKWASQKFPSLLLQVQLELPRLRSQMNEQLDVQTRNRQTASFQLHTANKFDGPSGQTTVACFIACLEPWPAFQPAATSALEAPNGSDASSSGLDKARATYPSSCFEIECQTSSGSTQTG